MAIAIVLVSLVVALAFAWMRPLHALLAAVFFLPWRVTGLDVGLNVNAYLIIIVPLLVVTCARVLLGIKSGSGKGLPPGVGVLWFILFYAVVWSLTQLPFLPELQVEGGVMRSPHMRSLSQIFKFFIFISPVFLVPILCLKLKDYFALTRIYIISISILALLGWIQIVFWLMTGRDPFPIGLVHSMLSDTVTSRSAAFSIGNSSVYRMSSLGGEPKNFAASLVVGMVLLQSGLGLVGGRALWLWVFLATSLIATMSTMGLLLWVGASAVQVFVSGAIRFTNIKSRMRLTASVLIGIIVLILLGGALVTSTNLLVRVWELIELRTIDRIVRAERGAMEDFNIAVYDFLVDQPLWAVTGVGLGNAHLYADPYLPEFARRYAGRSAFVAKSGGLRWVSELGVISLGLFLAWVFYIIKRTAEVPIYLSARKVKPAHLTRFSVPMVAMWLVSGYVGSQFFMMLGILIGLSILARQKDPEALSHQTTSKFMLAGRYTNLAWTRQKNVFAFCSGKSKI